MSDSTTGLDPGDPLDKGLDPGDPLDTGLDPGDPLAKKPPPHEDEKK
jgi:hypothetical protein